jgi:hypothetical protein
MYAPHVHEMTHEEVAINREQQARVRLLAGAAARGARQRHEFEATLHRSA